MALLRERRDLLRERAHRGVVFEYAPANLITILIEVRFCSSMPTYG